MAIKGLFIFNFYRSNIVSQKYNKSYDSKIFINWFRAKLYRRIFYMKIFQKKKWRYASIFTSFSLMLLIGFQNCKDQGVQVMLSQRGKSPTITSTLSSTTTLTTSQNDLSIVATSDENSTPYDDFPLQTAVILQLTSSKGQLQDFDSFQWGITEILLQDTDGSEFDTEQKVTAIPSLTHTFEDIGVYDISVIPIKSTEGELESTEIHKILVVEKCDDTHSVEIQLESNTPTQGSSSTFIVGDDSSSIQKEVQYILWDVRQNRQKIENSLLEVGDDGELTVTWNNISGQVTIRAFIQFVEDSCITDKKMQINLESVSPAKTIKREEI